MTEPDLDQIVDDYLHRLDLVLAQVPSPRRQELVAEVTEHIREARSQLPQQSEAAIRELLDRIGQPEDIAAEAHIDHLGPVPGRRRRLLVGLTAVIVLIAIGFGIAALATRSTSPGNQVVRPPTITTTTFSAPQSTVVLNVVGMTEASAVASLAAMGLDSRVENQSGSQAAPGIVFSQSPQVGSKVAEHSVVTLQVSTGSG